MVSLNPAFLTAKASTAKILPHGIYGLVQTQKVFALTQE